MRRRGLFGLLVSVTCLIGLWWYLQPGTPGRVPQAEGGKISAGMPGTVAAPPTTEAEFQPFQLLSGAGNLNSPVAEPPTPPANDRLAYRLSNTRQSLRELLHNDNALLLENALIDTTSGESLPIPAHLKADREPGSYIVQSRAPITAQFRSRVTKAGATIVAYIPNNGLLVKATSSTAQMLSADAAIGSVVAFEPYFKLKSSLLKTAVKQEPLPRDAALNVLLFPNTRDQGLAGLTGLGAEVLGEERSPFGSVVRVRPAAGSLAAIAQLQSVQGVELARRRISANDLSRPSIEVSADTVTPLNYLGLTGTNAIVSVNDTGVDTNHPDLAGRVWVDSPISGVDSNGHGTHVAGIIAGNGSQSTTVTNALGSVMPAVDGQFRGKAPGAQLFAMNSGHSDVDLQETARRTNAFISNNSWHYEAAEYDLAAASYDAAVRDALPGVTGSQSLLFVFPAGNNGQGDDDGMAGYPDGIYSPGTAKNVITVGAVEQYRNVTNVTLKNCETTIDGTNVTVVCETNTPWAGSTDSSNRIAGFSSRGNVGVGIEGVAGRFKPDVVAPGTFIVSTRSSTWDEGSYYNRTNYHRHAYQDNYFEAESLNQYLFWVPENAVAVDLEVAPSLKTPWATNFPIYVRQSDIPTTAAFDFMRTNHVMMPPDNGPTLEPRDTFWHYAVENTYDGRKPYYNVIETITTTNDNGNYFEVLSNINNQLGPFYRYESGTSMSAAQVSGTLALMQEFFETRLRVTNSPALMKALLINGARSVGNLYNFQVDAPMNFQGWGEVNLTNSLQNSLSNRTSATSSMFVFEQGETNSLTTGQSQTRNFQVDPKNNARPLRVTLVWTDPPGNPLAGTKLVNNLDLVVTNLDTGDVFYGNDILPGNDFNLSWDTNLPPTLDVVNNVENVYLPPRLSTNYSVTVVGRRVNVNAVTTHTNDVAQDYVLVVSCGNGEISDAITLQPPTPPLAFLTDPEITIISNTFPANTTVTGGVRYKQRVGANTPLLGTNLALLDMPTNGVLTLGMTNQWHFYVITNEASYTNAVFATFFPPTLSLPRMGANEGLQENATRREADIDLYVSTDPAITNLDTAAIETAFKSLSREGTETIVLTNATDYGDVFYIGVKSESQTASEYGFLGAFSLEPFSEDGLLNTFPNPAPIPDGSPALPGVVQVFGIQPESYLVRRVIVTNWVTHEMFGDLMGLLNHNQSSVWLNNHAPVSAITNLAFIYDDSDEGDIEGAVHSDGPGSLNEFAGGMSDGQWIFTMLDEALAHVGTNDFLRIFVEKQEDLTEGINVRLGAGRCRRDYIYVSDLATNLTVTVALQTGSGPLSVRLLRQGDVLANTMLIAGPGVVKDLVVDLTSSPPINPGMYELQICNLGPDTAEIFIQATILYDTQGIAPNIYATNSPMQIIDDAVSTSSIRVPADERLIAVEVGLRVNHPRISDLVMHLTSPQGTRVLLFENRGGVTPDGMGSDLVVTNIIPVSSAGGPSASTNVVNTGVPSGALDITWTFYGIPDRMVVYYETNVLLDTGMISGSGATNLTFGPGASPFVTIVMNPGDNIDAGTAWEYTIKSTMAQFVHTIFTEDTNKTLMPVKFAVTPFTNVNYIGTNWLYTNNIYYLPEDDLKRFATENAQGDWTLEVWDNRAGATNPAPALVSWELLLTYERSMPKPTLLTPDTAVTNTIAPGQFKYFLINVPSWAGFSTNTLIFADDDVNVWHNAAELPLGTNANDVLLLGPATTGVAVLTTNGSPPLIPGGSYYLGVQNTNAVPVTFAFMVEFDVTRLSNNVPVSGTLSVLPERHFYYEVGTNDTAVAFQLYDLTGDATLLVRKTPYPSFGAYTYGSFNSGTNAEEIIVTVDTDPVPLRPGRWYVGVFGATNISYTIRAVAYTNQLPRIVTLYNAMPRDATNLVSTAGTNDYYRFVVTTNALRAQFEITGASGEMALVARKGLLPPDFNSYDYLSSNPGTNDEMIVVLDSSTPVALTSGDWFITAVNLSGSVVTYTIQAREWAARGTNIFIYPPIISSNQLCLTWSSLPGMDYYVQGLVSLGGTNWQAASPTLRATDYLTTYCLPLPTPYVAFRISEGVAPAVVTPVPPMITSLQVTSGGAVMINWTAPLGAQFQVEWLGSLGGLWTAFPDVITSGTGDFTFTDSAPATPRFYRLRQL